MIALDHYVTGFLQFYREVFRQAAPKGIYQIGKSRSTKITVLKRFVVTTNTITYNVCSVYNMIIKCIKLDVHCIMYYTIYIIHTYTYKCIYNKTIYLLYI